MVWYYTSDLSVTNMPEVQRKAKTHNTERHDSAIVTRGRTPGFIVL